MLAVSEIKAGYDESQVLFGISFDLNAGEFVTLLGRNGMGKTTTISSIMGNLPLKGGRIHFRGKPIHGLPSYRIAQLGIGLVPEGRQIFPNLSVRENLVATAATRGVGRTHWTLGSVLDVFPSLRERLETFGGLLSGGEQQMLAIGRALMTNPHLLILDEATEGLAPLIRAEIWRVLDALKATGQSTLVVDKNVDALCRIADRHYILERGKIVWSGSSAALKADNAIRHRYLGVCGSPTASVHTANQIQTY